MHSHLHWVPVQLPRSSHVIDLQINVGTTCHHCINKSSSIPPIHKVVCFSTSSQSCIYFYQDLWKLYLFCCYKQSSLKYQLFKNCTLRVTYLLCILCSLLEFWNCILSFFMFFLCHSFV